MDGLAYDELPNDPEALKTLLIEHDHSFTRLRAPLTNLEAAGLLERLFRL